MKRSLKPRPTKKPPVPTLSIPEVTLHVYHHFPEGIPETTAFDAVIRLQIQHLKHARVSLKAAVTANRIDRSKGE